MPSPSSESVGTAGTIILVEDYDSLSIAFGSTLKKLAPNYETVVVRSLAEAEIAAAGAKPKLFVIDFDPPHSGAVGFFNRMKAAYPDARVLVIGASAWLDLDEERMRPGAFQFIAKPFELSKFGAVVQGLLPSDGSGTARSLASGALRDLDLTDLIALFGTAAVTTILRVTAIGGATGEIYFSGGQMTQAVVMGKAGVAALEEMLRWSAPRFVENEMRTHPTRTIQGPWTLVMLEALRAARTFEAPAEDSDEMPGAAAPTENSIVVIDDTELLLIFVEDALRTARPSLEIATAASGVEGLKRTSELLPDLVLLDYSLPDIAGDAVCRLLLEDERTAHIPVIMMSGHVAEMAATAERFPNVVATIEKPFLSAALVELVEATLADLPKVAARPVPPPKPAPRPSARRGKKTSPPKSSRAQVKSPPAISKPTYSAPTPARPEKATTSKAVKPKERASDAPPVPKSEIPVSPPEPPVSFRTDSATPPSPVSTEPAAEPSPSVDPPGRVPAPTSPPPAPPPPEATAPRREVQGKSVPAAEETPTITGPVAPARVRAAKSSTVVLTLPLEITSIQFSPLLETRAIRAKPFSPIVSVHILPDQVSGVRVAAMSFELDHVDLDTRGQINTLRLKRSTQPLPAPEAGSPVIIADVAAFPGDGTMQVMPASGKPTRIQLLALFEVVAVELTPTFVVEYLILKARGAKVRLHLRPGDASTGVTFESAQVLLDRSARIAEVLLDAPE